jgi:hypothetical protein
VHPWLLRHRIASEERWVCSQGNLGVKHFGSKPTERSGSVLPRAETDQPDRRRRAGPGGGQRPPGRARRPVLRDAHDDAVPLPELQLSRRGETLPRPHPRHRHRGDKPRRAHSHHHKPAAGRLPAIPGERHPRRGRLDPASHGDVHLEHPPLPCGRPGRHARGRGGQPLVGFLRLQLGQPGPRPALQPHARVHGPAAEVPHLRDERQQDPQGHRFPTS